MCEPAARRVDDLMNLFAGTDRDIVRGSVWVTEIQNGIEQVTNPKSAEALQAARVEIALIKFYGAQVLYNVIDRAIQVHGSLGFSTDMPLEHMYRAARAARQPRPCRPRPPRPRPRFLPCRIGRVH